MSGSPLRDGSGGRRAGRLVRSGPGLRFLFLSAAVLAGLTDIVAEEPRLLLLSVLLVAYLAFEIALLRAGDGGPWLINPVVLTSILSLILSFGVLNFGYLVWGADLPEYILGSSAYFWMCRALVYAIAAAIGLWAGYRAGVGRRFVSWIRRSAFFQRHLFNRNELNRGFVLMAVAVSVAARVTQASLGVFGYSSEPERLVELASITQYLALGVALGGAALAALAISCFRAERPERATTAALIFLTTMETFFGILSGFKSQIVIPVLIVGACYYGTKRRFPKRIALASVLLVVLAYQVVEPFRLARFERADFPSRSLVGISEVVLTGIMEEYPPGLDPWSFWDFGLPAFVNRMNLVPEAARSIQFIEESVLPEGAPAFLRNLFLFPAYAVVPRLIWPSKPLNTLGSWYAINVRGEPPGSTTAIGMTPVGYLYAAGGGLAVVAGFFVIGMIHRAVYETVRGSGAGGLLVLLGYSLGTAILTSSVDMFLASVIRMVPILIAAQLLFFRKGTARPGGASR